MQSIQLGFKESLEIHHYLQRLIAFFDPKQPTVNPRTASCHRLRQNASQF